MGVLNINKDTAMPILATEWQVIVNMAVSQRTLDQFIKNPDYRCCDVEVILKTQIEMLEDVGPYAQNIKDLIRNITKNHDQMYMETRYDTNMDDSIRTIFLRTRSDKYNYDIISITLRNKKVWYKTY